MASNNPKGRGRKDPGDPRLHAEAYQTVLRAQLKHGSPLPWSTPQELAEFLGPRPDSAYVSRHNKHHPHGPGNTCWSTDSDSEEKKALRYALLESSKRPVEPSKQPSGAFKRETQATPARKEINAHEAREQNPSTRGLTRRLDNLQVRLLRQELPR